MKLYKLKRTALFPAVFILMLNSGTVLSQADIDSLIDAAVEFAQIQLEKTLTEIDLDSTVYPSETIDTSHKWLAEGYKSWDSWWTSGYFPACYWYMYQLTQEEKWKTYAEKWSARLESQKGVEDFSNIADIIYFSFGNGYKNTYDEHYAAVVAEAASTYIKLYDKDIEAIKCWGGTWSKTNFAVVTDILIDNEFLFLTYQLTGNKDFYDVVTDHINKTIDYNIREDGSVWQFVDFNLFGDPIGYINTTAYQGAPGGTRWTRAHAWAINGLTQAYRYTLRQKYLDAAKRIADFFTSHLPDDFVPPSDFDVALDEENGRDAAAAAIACSGLFELAQYTDDHKYREYADSIMASLCSTAYLAAGSDYSSILKRGQVRYTEPEKGLIYADAFFLEAILKYKGLYHYYIEGEGPINFSPVAKAGNDQTMTDSDQNHMEIVTLNGSWSYDPDDSIALYEWMIDSELVGTGKIHTDTLQVGSHQVVLVVTDKYGKTGSDTLQVTILADYTGVDVEWNQTGQIEIIPNPADHGMFSLKIQGLDYGEQIVINIYDLSGKLTCQEHCRVPSEKSIPVKLNGYKPGVYILKVSGNSYIQNKKVILN